MIRTQGLLSYNQRSLVERLSLGELTLLDRSRVDASKWSIEHLTEKRAEVKSRRINTQGRWFRNGRSSVHAQLY